MTRTDIRNLKGAPLSVFLLLHLERQPCPNYHLIRWTGYTDKTIAAACDYLASPEVQLITRTPGGWVIAQNYQPALPYPPPPEGGIEGGQGHQHGEIPSLFVVDVNSNILINNNNNSDGISPTPANRKEPPQQSEPAEIAECWRLLAEAGIKRNTRTERILAQPHITPAYISAVLETPVPAGIRSRQAYRINQLEQPPTQTGDHPDTETTHHHRYITGKFADYVQH